MSFNGIYVFANVLSDMQTARDRLLQSGCKGPVDKQDIRLAQMLDDMKDTVKEEFTRVTLQ